MRETIVLELWAHGLDELAWPACRADESIIDGIAAANQAAPPPHTGTELARHAIEIMTGSPARAPLVRSRSPILDMPADLRYAAHRTATIDTLATALDGVRHRRGRWSWLRIEVRDGPFYLQFSAWPGPGIAAEAVGASNLDGPSRSRLDGPRLEQLAWVRPDENSAGNWQRTYGSPGREDLRSVATTAIVTLEQGYGVGPPVRYMLEADGWTDDQMRRKRRMTPSPDRQRGLS